MALEAVGRKEAYAFVSPPGGRDNQFTVKATMKTQQAEIREIAAQGPAREKWFAEHEA